MLSRFLHRLLVPPFYLSKLDVTELRRVTPNVVLNTGHSVAASRKQGMKESLLLTFDERYYLSYHVVLMTLSNI